MILKNIGIGFVNANWRLDKQIIKDFQNIKWRAIKVVLYKFLATDT